MTPARLSVPFSLTILTLMALVLAPLSSALLWLGWRSVDTLEQRSADDARGGTGEGGRAVPDRGPAGRDLCRPDPGRFAELCRPRRACRRRRTPPPACRACWGGIPPWRRPSSAMPTGASSLPAVLRPSRPPSGPTSTSTTGMRSSCAWSTARARHAAKTRGSRRPTEPEAPSASGPPTTIRGRRPWYVEAEKAGDPALTAPYRFAWSKHAGISAGVPLLGGGGVIGFDYTLETLSQLLTSYKITPNAIIMVGHGTWRGRGRVGGMRRHPLPIASPTMRKSARH